MKLVFLGPPGAGKGTQAKVISEKLNIPHISTGDIFRENINNQTDLGKKAKEYNYKGLLVPDDITNSMVKERLQRNDCKKGYILDGYPRTVNQAQYLESIDKVDKVVCFVLSDELAKERMLGRAKDSDKNETVTYSLNLSREVSFNHIIDQYNAIADTIFQFPIPQTYDAGNFYWKVVAADGAGNSVTCNTIFLFSLPAIGVEADADGSAPREFALYQNHPNPFNPETKLSYQLPKTCHVRLTIYNNLGQKIRTLIDEEQNAGTFYKYWNGRNDNDEPVSSGIYVYKLEAGDFVMAKRMMLLQ